MNSFLISRSEFTETDMKTFMFDKVATRAHYRGKCYMGFFNEIVWSEKGHIELFLDPTIEISLSPKTDPLDPGERLFDGNTAIISKLDPSRPFVFILTDVKRVFSFYRDMDGMMSIQSREAVIIFSKRAVDVISIQSRIDHP